MSEEVTATQAAQITGLSLRTITTRLSRGQIPGAYRVQPPGEPWQWRIPRAALDGLQRDASSDLEARVSALERQFEELRRMVGAPPTHSEAQERPLQPPRPIGIAETGSTRSDSPRSNAQRVYSVEGIPAEWEPAKAFGERHGISKPTITSQHRSPRPQFTAYQIPPQEGGEWYLDPENQRAAVLYWFGSFRPKPGTPPPVRCDVPGCPCHTD